MSKEIYIDFWVSIVPDSLYQSWIDRKMIRKGSSHFGTSEKHAGKYIDTYEKGKDRKWKQVVTKEEAKKLKAQGWKLVYHVYMVSEENMKIIHTETGLFYKEVFEYVEKWLQKNNFIDLREGSFRGGFCVVDAPTKDTKLWGMPVSGERNKVVQIKEKFGRIVVYFGNLSDKERDKVVKFEKHVTKRFDCLADFC